MKFKSMTLFWFYMKFAVLLISVSSILAAILVSIDLDGLRAFNDLFNILP